MNQRNRKLAGIAAGYKILSEITVRRPLNAWLETEHGQRER